MKSQEFLSEGKYQDTKNKILSISKMILIGGLLIGGLLLGIGGYKTYQIKAVFPKQIAKKEAALTSKKEELQAQIQPTLDEIKKIQRTEFNGFDDAYYERQNQILRLTESIRPIQTQISEMEMYFNIGWCLNPTITKEVCDLKDNSSFNTIPYFIGGGFTLIATFMIYGSIMIFAKRREMIAFSMQQVMPVAQEGLENITPTVTKVGKRLVQEMAPAYGEVAKEISKGITEGIKESKNNDEK